MCEERKRASAKHAKQAVAGAHRFASVWARPPALERWKSRSRPPPKWSSLSILFVTDPAHAKTLWQLHGVIDSLTLPTV